MPLTFIQSTIQPTQTDNLWELIIPKNKTIDSPIHLQKESGNATFNLKLEEGSKATLIEEWNEENNGENNYQLNVHCAPHSQLTYITLHHSGLNAKVIEKRHFEVQENAQVNVAFFCFGGTEIESSIAQKTTGRNVNMQMTVVAKSQNNQKMSFKTAQVFDAKQSTGHMDMRGVAEDQAQLNLNGLIKITKNGGQTDASLDEHILNLSQKTKVDAAPALEIDTNDVKAAHSAGIHNVSEEEILYLSARGLEKEQAKQMLVSGFLRAGLSSIQGYPEIIKDIEAKM